MGKVLSSYKAAVEFREDRFNPIPLMGSEHMRVILVCLEAGQFLPVHYPEVDLCVTVLEGEGRIVSGGVEEKAAPGAVAFMSRGEARGVLAESRMILLNVVAPIPTAEDHEAAFEKLKTGRWK
ncbi:MAG: cupin [Acidobacteriota bacterium]|jgi:quercetin dioxygenase-like cupin family protein